MINPARVLAVVRAFREFVEVAVLGAISYAIIYGGATDTKPLAFAVVFLTAVTIDARDLLRRIGDLLQRLGKR
jgi:hypothetical protein